MKINSKIYPDWMSGFQHPNLQTKTLKFSYIDEFWERVYHFDLNGVISGTKVCDLLETQNLLPNALGAEDLSIVQGYGPQFFHDFLNKESVYTLFGWKSIIKHKSGGLFVPSIDLYKGEIQFLWQKIPNSLELDLCPILLFKN